MLHHYFDFLNIWASLSFKSVLMECVLAIIRFGCCRSRHSIYDFRAFAERGSICDYATLDVVLAEFLRRDLELEVGRL